MDHILLFSLAFLISAGGYFYWRRWLGDYEPSARVLLWAALMVTILALAFGHVAFYLAAQLPPAAAWRFFATTQGWASGYQSLGMITGAVLALLLTALINRQPLLLLLDVLSPAAFVVSAVWRTGCFYHGCCYGAPSSVPWAVSFPLVPELGVRTPPSHPVQLYEVFASLIVFLLLPWVSRRWRVVPGTGLLALTVALFYSAERFLIEYFRIGGTATVVSFGLSATQLITLAVLLISGGMLLGARTRRS